MKYKGYNISDTEIDKLMDKLDISLEEACETILSDREVIENETVNELSKKATKNRRFFNNSVVLCFCRRTGA